MGANFDLAEYTSQRSHSIYFDIFGFDMIKRVKDVINTMGSNYSVTPPIQDGLEYNGGTIRSYEPDKGGLRAHTGNEFAELFKDDGLKFLWEKTKIINSMSYFVVIQPPEVGGELVLFDLLWEDTPESLKGFDSNQRENTPFLRFDQEVTPVVPGELIIFAGGRIWHMVKEIDGINSRITFGGFLAITRDDQSIWFWS
jgi:hypothetical protein